MILRPPLPHQLLACHQDPSHCHCLGEAFLHNLQRHLATLPSVDPQNFIPIPIPALTPPRQDGPLHLSDSGVSSSAAGTKQLLDK